MQGSRIGKVVRDLGPLMLIALLIPGGTLIAGLVYFLRRKVA
jgi:hypothetical protein